MPPGAYKSGYFATLFLDIRRSTERTVALGPLKTLLTMQALLPSLARIVCELDGFVVEYPGDGIMAHWDGDKIGDSIALIKAIQAAGWMDDCVKRIVNPILNTYQIESIECGIGVDAGNIIITKIGNPDFIASKSFGPSINHAAKLSANKFNLGVLVGRNTLGVIQAQGYSGSLYDHFNSLQSESGDFYHLDTLSSFFLLPSPRSKELEYDIEKRIEQSFGLRSYMNYTYEFQGWVRLGLY
ncbi:adenylate/guanylate cyclase domain-containing protein [Desulfonatronum parangueonense]